jgi:hypothetical protein
MKVIAVVIGLSVFLIGPATAAAEICETSKAGIKRCEHIFPALPGGATMKTIVYSDRSANIRDWEIDFPTDTKLNLPAVTLIEVTMGILTPNSTSEDRIRAFRSLAENAVKGESRMVVLGNYDWMSARLNENFMMRATIRKGTAADPKKRGVEIGMTGSEIRRSSWGNPRQINTTITARSRHEQWVYGGSYLYLDNGMLTSIQTNR